METKSYEFGDRVRGTPPPTIPTIAHKVIRITSPEKKQVVILSDRPWGTSYHWVGNSSMAHVEGATCQWCDRNAPLKWRAYMHCHLIEGSGVLDCILEMTYVGLVMMEVQLCGQPMRGAMYRIGKTKGGKHGRFQIECMPRRVDPATLPPEIDPAPILEKLWRINENKACNGK